MKNLGNQKMSTLLRNFSIPATIGLMIGVVYNIVDRMFIAKGIGVLGIAGVSITLPITTLYLAIGLLVGVGSSVVISISLGQKNIEKVEKIIGTTLTFIVIVGLACTVLFQYYLKDLLLMLGASENILPYAMEYSRYLLIGSVFSILIPGFNNIIRGTGSPKSSMLYALIGAILNIFLDYLFIMKLDLGMKGASTATVISMGVSALLIICHYLYFDKNIKLRLKFLKIDKELLLKTMSIGSGPFILQLASAVTVIVINNRFKIYGGDVYIASYGIINSLIMLMRLPAIGIQQGAQTIIGYNYGAKKYDRIIEAFNLSMKVVLVISTIGFILAQFFPRFLVNLFISNNPELMKVAVTGIRIFFGAVFLQGVNIIGAYLFMALGMGKVSLKLNILQQVILVLPLTYFLPVFVGVNGAWLGVPIAEFLTALVVLPMAYKKIKELKRLENGSKYRS